MNILDTPLRISNSNYQLPGATSVLQNSDPIHRNSIEILTSIKSEIPESFESLESPTKAVVSKYAFKIHFLQYLYLNNRIKN